MTMEHARRRGTYQIARRSGRAGRPHPPPPPHDSSPNLLGHAETASAILAYFMVNGGMWGGTWGCRAALRAVVVAASRSASG